MRTTPGAPRVRKRVPCVTFIVRRKWDKNDADPAHVQHLPAHLLTFADIGGKRQLCAVPTDVQTEDAFYGATPHGASAVHIDDIDVEAYGAATCLVKVGAGKAAKTMLMSARHVFSPHPEIVATPASKLAVSALHNGQRSAPPLARTSRHGGLLHGNGSVSFDVQLADIANLNAAVALVQRMRTDGKLDYVASVDALVRLSHTAPWEVLVPADNPLWHGDGARPNMMVELGEMMSSTFGFEYRVREHGALVKRHITFWRLMRVKVQGSEPLLAGDSGSALVAWERQAGGAINCVLLGMFIGSNSTHAYVIPAWQLFDRDYYASLPPGDVLQPVRP